MSIAKNEWYTIKYGDTLSKIAKEAGISDWRIIYNDPKNEEFRKKRPNPDKIYPGDEIWIPDPSRVRTSTGKSTVFVAKVKEKIQVTEIFFESQIKIYYVRLLADHPDYIAPHVPDIPGYLHLNPPKVYPEADKPHWMFKIEESKILQSWPTVLIRDGSFPKGEAKRNLYVTFYSSLPFDGECIIKAESIDGKVTIGENVVSFIKGKAVKVKFTFTKIPDKVEKLSGIILKWYAKKRNEEEFREICETPVTIYTIDNIPLKANLRGKDMYLFEIIDWACTWAQGRSGKEEVIKAIWKEFYPVKSNHSTGLVYWKNWRLRIDPAQTIDLAIRSMDDIDPLTRNAVSCVVFDNIFINCLLLNGINAAEIKIVPSNPLEFTKEGKKYFCIGFNSSSTNAQGNNDSPPSWYSHWLANINDNDISSKWNIYDPSYGLASYQSSLPSSVGKSVDVLEYEKVGIKDFICEETHNHNIVNLLAGSKPSEPPHISGIVVWTSI